MKMSEWSAVLEFIDILDTKPLDDTFENWFYNSWESYQTKCINMAKHHYILKKALDKFQERYTTQDKNWELSFIENEQKAHLHELCIEVGINSEEFLHFGFNHHRNACKKHHTSTLKMPNTKM